MNAFIPNCELNHNKKLLIVAFLNLVIGPDQKYLMCIEGPLAIKF